MSAISDITVTYGSALAPAKYHRIVTLEGHGADVNKGNGPPVYLWSKDRTNKEPAIVDISVIYDGEDVPEGFEKVSKTLLKGVDRQAYICVKKSEDPDVPAVGKILILYGDEQLPDTEEGYTKLERPLNPASNDVYMHWKPAEEEQKGDEWSVEQLKEGDWFDCKDTTNKFLVAKVVEVKEDRIHVHYKGWPSRWDAWFYKTDTSKFAKLGTFTAGKDTRPRIRQGELWEATEEEFAQVEEMMKDFMEGTMPPDEQESWLKVDLPTFLEKTLASRYHSDMVERVEEFLQSLIEFCVWYLKQKDTVKIPPEINQQIIRIFLGDDNASWFYHNNGMTVHGSAEAEAANDWFANIPPSNASKYFVINMNHFGKCGGYTAMLERMECEDPQIPLEDLDVFVKVLECGKWCYSPPFIDEMYPRFQKAIFSRISNMNDAELKDLDERLLDRIIRHISVLLPHVAKSKGLQHMSGNELLESFRLMYSLRLIKSPYMAQRIKGVKEILDLTREVDARENPEKYYTRSSHMFPYETRRIRTTQWLTAEKFARWLTEKKVVEILLGGEVDGKKLEPHVELLKRVPEIITFLAEHRSLGDEPLHLLWSASQSLNEVQRRAALEVVEKISPHLLLNQIDALWADISKVPASEVDEVVLSTIKNFTSAALRVQDSETRRAAQLESTLGEARNRLEAKRAEAEQTADAESGEGAGEGAGVGAGDNEVDRIDAQLERLALNEQRIKDTLARERQSYGLPYLAEVMRKTKGDTSKDARTALVELLKEPAASEEMTQYLDQCFQSIKKDEAVMESLSLAIELISGMDDFEEVDGETPECVTILEGMETKYSVREMLIGRISAYIQQFRELWNGEAVEKPSELKVVDGVEHGEAVRKRLDLLKLFLNFTTLTLSFEEVSKLWDILVVNSMTSVELDGFLSFLQQIQEVSSKRYLREWQRGMKDEDVGRVFYELVCGENASYFSKIGMKGMKAFQAAFRDANEAAGKIDVLATGGSFIVRDYNFEGLETLWNIIAFATSPLVRRALRVFFVQLYMKGDRRDLESEQATWRSLIDDCFKRAAKAFSSENPSEKERLHLQAALEVVTELLEYFERLGSLAHRASQNRDPDIRELQVVVCKYPEKYSSNFLRVPVNVRVHTIQQLRDVIAKKLSMRPQCVRLLFYTNDQLMPVEEYNSKTIAECHGVQRYITAQWVEEPDEDTAKHVPGVPIQDVEFDERTGYCRGYIADSRDYFDLLFACLRVEGPVSRLAHKMLQQLPTNSEKQEYVATLAGSFDFEQNKPTGKPMADEEWKELVDPSAPMKLLYTLQIISDLLVDKERSKGWTSQFLASGGLVKLSDCLRQLDVSVMLSGVLHKRCLAQLLQTVNHLLHSADGEESGSSVETFENPEIVETLLKCIEGAAETVPPTPSSKALPTEESKGEDDTKSDDKVAPEEAAHSASITRESVKLMVEIAVRHPSLLSHLYQHEGISTSFKFALLECGDESVREDVSKAIINLCQQVKATEAVESPVKFFLPFLLDNMKQCFEHPKSCKQFFNTLCSLLQDVTDLSTLRIDTEEILAQLADLIVNHPTVEIVPRDKDHILMGLLRVLTGLVHGRNDLKEKAANPKGYNIMQSVFMDCLFATPSRDHPPVIPPPKAKNAETRRAAYDLLAELSTDLPINSGRLCAMALPLVEQRTKDKKKDAPKKKLSWWERDYDAAKSATGYVGLRNLGCICYMNSSMQQLFMIKEFRQGVLEWRVPEEEEDKKENIMYQLQRMFGYLQESEKMAYNPRPFCQAFKDWDNNPVDVTVQQDASEFLTNLFTKVEGQIEGSPQDKLLKKTLAGKKLNELIAKDGELYSSRYEDFYYITVPVVNMKHLPQALSQIIKGEQVDYKWELEGGEKQELPTMKRESFAELPPHLFIHLKRFEFNFDTFQQVKVNDRFDFPVDLDMKPYTIEGRPDRIAVKATDEDGKPLGPTLTEREDEYYKYKLMGIVVHTGTAQAGHYYSYIRERHSVDGKEHWFEFNDSTVIPFDIASLESSCFGGEDVFTYGSSYGQPYVSKRERHHNAFVLVYDRADTLEAPMKASKELDDEESRIVKCPLSTTEQDALLKRYRERKAQLSTRGTVPPDIYKEIWEDNEDFLRSRNVSDKEYSVFMWNLVKNAASSKAQRNEYPSKPLQRESDALALGGERLQVVKLATTFLLKILASGGFAESGASISEWKDKLEVLYEHDVLACYWFLQTLLSKPSLVKSYLLSEEADVRILMQSLIRTAQNNLGPAETVPSPSEVSPVVPLADVVDPDSESKGDQNDPEFPAPHGALVVTFLESMLAMMPYMNAEARTFGEYFKVIEDFANVSEKHCKYLIERDTVSQLADFLCQDDTPKRHPANCRPDEKEGAEPGAGAGAHATPSHRIGSVHSPPNLIPVITVLERLVLSCRPPNGSTDSPYQKAPSAPLPEGSVTYLAAPALVRVLASQCKSHKKSKTLEPFIGHLVWKSPEATAAFLNGTIAEMEKNDFDKYEPLFRFLTVLATTEHKQEDGDIGRIMVPLLELIRKQTKYYSVTIESLRLLLKMSKRFSPIRTWLSENKEMWEFGIEFLKTYPAEPTATDLSGGKIELRKRVVGDHSAPARPRHLLAHLMRVYDGEDAPRGPYESDDEPDCLVGKRIVVQWASNKWYKGNVIEYRPTTDEHFVRYDDGDRKWYYMPEKTFRLLQPNRIEPRDGQQLDPNVEDIQTWLEELEANRTAADAKKPAQSTPAASSGGTGVGRGEALQGDTIAEEAEEDANGAEAESEDEVPVEDDDDDDEVDVGVNSNAGIP